MPHDGGPQAGQWPLRFPIRVTITGARDMEWDAERSHGFHGSLSRIRSDHRNCCAASGLGHERSYVRLASGLWLLPLQIVGINSVMCSRVLCLFLHKSANEVTGMICLS